MSDTADYTLDHYWLAIYSRKWVILLVAFASAAFAVYAGRLITPRYEAMAEFYVPQDRAGPVQGPESGKLRIPGIREHALVYTGVLRSKSLQRKVADAFPQRDSGQIAASMDVVVSPSASLRVYVRDSDPIIAAGLANGLVAAFQEFHMELINEHLVSSLESVTAQRATAHERMSALEQERQSFLEKLGITSLDAAMAELQSASARRDDEVSTATVALHMANERIAAVEKEIRPGKRSAELSDELLADLRTLLSEARVEKATTAARIDALKQAQQKLRKRLSAMPAKAATLARIEERRERSERDIRHFEQRAQNIRDEIAKLLPAVVVLDEALPPTQPVFPNVALNGIVAGAAGLVVGVLYAFFLDHLLMTRRRRQMAELRDAQWTEELVSDQAGTT